MPYDKGNNFKIPTPDLGNDDHKRWRYRGWTIKWDNDRDAWILFNKDGEEDWDTGSREEAKDWIDSYNQDIVESDNLSINESEPFKNKISDTKIAPWYIKTYKSDELGPKINPKVTFQEVIDNPSNVYELIGVEDSVVRERIFDKIANILEISYDDVYYAWIDNHPIKISTDNEKVFANKPGDAMGVGDAIYYLQHHNKNLTKQQDEMINLIADWIEKYHS